MSKNLDPSNFIFDEPEERAEFTTFPKGEYPFTILEVNSMTTSKAGSPMIPIKMEFKDKDGNTSNVYENLVFTENAAWKVKQFLKCVCGEHIAAGRRVDFEDPKFLSWLAKRGGRAKLKVESYTKDGNERTRNAVDAFLYDKAAAPAAKPAPAPAPVEEEEEDDCPF